MHRAPRHRPHQQGKAVDEVCGNFFSVHERLPKVVFRKNLLTLLQQGDYHGLGPGAARPGRRLRHAEARQAGRDQVSCDWSVGPAILAAYWSAPGTVGGGSETPRGSTRRCTTRAGTRAPTTTISSAPGTWARTPALGTRGGP